MGLQDAYNQGLDAATTMAPKPKALQSSPAMVLNTDIPMSNGAIAPGDTPAPPLKPAAQGVTVPAPVPDVAAAPVTSNAAPVTSNAAPVTSNAAITQSPIAQGVTAPTVSPEMQGVVDSTQERLRIEQGGIANKVPGPFGYSPQPVALTPERAMTDATALAQKTYGMRWDDPRLPGVSAAMAKDALANQTATQAAQQGLTVKQMENTTAVRGQDKNLEAHKITAEESTKSKIGEAKESRLAHVEAARINSQLRKSGDGSITKREEAYLRGLDHQYLKISDTLKELDKRASDEKYTPEIRATIRREYVAKKAELDGITNEMTKFHANKVKEADGNPAATTQPGTAGTVPANRPPLDAFLESRENINE
jgi:hypothetical protein